MHVDDAGKHRMAGKAIENRLGLLGVLALNGTNKLDLAVSNRHAHRRQALPRRRDDVDVAEGKLVRERLRTLGQLELRVYEGPQRKRHQSQGNNDSNCYFHEESPIDTIIVPLPGQQSYAASEQDGSALRRANSGAAEGPPIEGGASNMSARWLPSAGHFKEDSNDD